MKIIGWVNGWREIPECWRRLLWPPVRIHRSRGWISVRALGFAVFLERKPEVDA